MNGNVLIDFINESISVVAVLYQKRLKKERRARQRAQDQLDSEMKRRSKIEEALKASGAPAEVLRIVTGDILGTYLDK